MPPMPLSRFVIASVHHYRLYFASATMTGMMLAADVKVDIQQTDRASDRADGLQTQLPLTGDMGHQPATHPCLLHVAPVDCLSGL